MIKLVQKEQILNRKLTKDFFRDTNESHLLIENCFINDKFKIGKHDRYSNYFGQIKMSV